MGQETQSGHFGEVRSPSTAGGGTALSTTAAFIGFPEGTRYVTIVPRNFATAVVAQIGFCPYLFVLKTTDGLATAAALTEYTREAQDDKTTTVVTLDSLDTAANLDFLYIGSLVPFAGVHCDVGAPNGTASVITVKYWNGSSWVDISDTDGTTSGGATLAIDGIISWAIPTAWVADSLYDIGDSVLGIGDRVETQGVYWTRWEFSVALDSEVELNHMLAVPRWTDHMELISGQGVQGTVSVGAGTGGVSGIQALVDAGTANLVVNVSTAAAGKVFA